MSSTGVKMPPPDQKERRRALDPERSVLVQAPAGSGKTDLLARRFLRLLCEVEEPGQVVAITFTKAAAAEMRNRILREIERAARSGEEAGSAADEFSMEALAQRALWHSERLGWNLLDLPTQLRIGTIDSFCRDLALQQPLLSGLGGGLEIFDQPEDFYRRAARAALSRIDESDSHLGEAVEALLLWRDNNWQEMEGLLVEMLAKRDKWMHGFLLAREPDWDALRERLERPFARVVREALIELSGLFDTAPGALEEALALARFACEEPGKDSPWELAQCAEIPQPPFTDGIESALDVNAPLSKFLQTQKGGWRSPKGLKTSDGFPSTPRGQSGKARFATLIAKLAAVPRLDAALAGVRSLPPARYTEEDWRIVRACFTLLRRAAGELQIAFAEAGAADYVEVAQVAQSVLRDADGLPTDAAMTVADGIRHLLVDEFQDTSRRQHQLLASLVAAWPERTGRSCFVVGDPMQSIYFFRDADAELFPRVRDSGLEIAGEEPLRFDSVQLSTNFRSTGALIQRLNQVFSEVCAVNDGSKITFSPSIAAPEGQPQAGPQLVTRPEAFTLHTEFVPQRGWGKSASPEAAREREAAEQAQIGEIVELIRGYREAIDAARSMRERGEDKKFRVAVLGRARKHLTPIAEALREAKIPFRAVELEGLEERPEVLDALALARALVNPQDRVAWLGLLRAPWCGLSLEDLYVVAGEPAQSGLPVRELLAEKIERLSEAGRAAAQRLLAAVGKAGALRASQPTASLGTWVEGAWTLLGGDDCVDAAARFDVNLLWSCLDRLTGGEEDLFGPALDAALKKLFALPDPEASGECGVQLMTIHKAKGLEFEVVIVPEMQAAPRRSKRKMLSWLERGLAEPDESGEITEFLVGPIQSKGKESGAAKQWVDRVYRERESQETRRLLYVAATRACKELHFFARPEYKVEATGELSLANAPRSLLESAWPALEAEVQERFDQWKTVRAALMSSEELVVESIAAAGGNNLRTVPSPVKPTILRRLPPDYQPNAQMQSMTRTFAELTGLGSGPSRLYSRHEGGMLSRALGSAVHSLLEELARLRERHDWETSRSLLLEFKERTIAQVRAKGVAADRAAEMAAQALDLALRATEEPVGQWILSPRAGAESEACWAGVVGGSLRTVRVDRVFKAGPAPCLKGEDCWWIIDYKTAHADNLDPAMALPELRALFRPQLEAYGAVLRNLYGSEAHVFAGLYYPRMRLLDWWEM